jgi:thiol-disulfide isomerase/thioredoxin
MFHSLPISLLLAVLTSLPAFSQDTPQSPAHVWSALFQAESDTSAVELTPTPKAYPSRPLQWLVFHTPSCLPCLAAIRDFQPWLEASGWQIHDGPQAHLRLIDATREPALAAHFQITAWPTFLLVQDGRILERHSPYPGRQLLADHYLAAAKKIRSQADLTARPALSEPVGAISIGSIPNGAAQVAQLLEATRPLLEAGVAFEGRLIPQPATSTSPPPTSTLIPLTDTARLRLHWPLTFRLTRQRQSLQIVFEKPYPQFLLTSPLPLEQPIQALTATTSAITIELPRMIDLQVQLE